MFRIAVKGSAALIAAVALSLWLVPQEMRAVPAIAQTNVQTVSACGRIIAFVPASQNPGVLVLQTATATASLVLAPGASLTGTPPTLNANVCLSGTLNSAGQVTSGTVSTTSGQTGRVCGTITAFALPTQSTSGYVTITGSSGSGTYAIAPGAALTGQPLLLGSSVCIQGPLNGIGQFLSAGVTANGPQPSPAPSPGAGGRAALCGVVGAYSPGSSLTVGGVHFAIAPGTSLPSSVTSGANLCIQLTLNSAGQITSATVAANGKKGKGSKPGWGCGDPNHTHTGPPGNPSATSPCTSVSASQGANGTTHASLCGVVSNYAAGGSSITIGAIPFALVPGAAVHGTVANGANQCFQLTLNPGGQVSALSVSSTLSACTGGKAKQHGNGKKKKGPGQQSCSSGGSQGDDNGGD